MKTAIITGANGFIGSALTKELLKHDYYVYAIVHENHDNHLPRTDKCKIVSCELLSIGSLVKLIPKDEPEYFFHLAWTGSAGPARSDTKIQLNNVQWCVDALRTAKKLGCKRFIGAGSIMEHETAAAVYTQGNRPGPAYIYGSAKMTAHAMCSSVAAEIGIDLLWLEITNAYGVGEVSPRLVNATIQKCIRKEPPQFTSGMQNYDFVYIDDAVRAFRMIAENGKAFHEYLIGSGTARPLREFLEEMNAAIAPDLEFVYGNIPFTGINLPLEMFDCNYTAQDTGFQAQVSFAEGCRRTFEWWKRIQKGENA